MTRLRPRAATMPSTTTKAPRVYPRNTSAALEDKHELAGPVPDGALER